MQLLVQKGQRKMERDFLTWHRLMLRMHEPYQTPTTTRWDAAADMSTHLQCCG